LGLRFNLSVANWVAHLIQPGARIPPASVAEFGDNSSGTAERETLSLFLHKLGERFFSSPESEYRFHERVQRAIERLEDQSKWNERVRDVVLGELRAYFARRTWTALLIPSSNRDAIDRVLCSEAFLRRMVRIRPEDPGLVLQLEEPPQERFSLTDVFPAFRTALSHSTQWPGVLVWTPQGDSVFLPLPSTSEGNCEEAAHWIFWRLGTSLGIDAEMFLSEYLQTFPATRSQSGTVLHVLQLSDLHIGCSEASQRLPRVAQLVRNVLGELDDASRVGVLVSGDVIDTPEESYVDIARSFFDFLNNLGTFPPEVLLGNHDVRRDGYLNENLRMVLRMPGAAARVVWYDDAKVALVCTNSVIDGRLARGFVGEQQLIDLGNEIDRKANAREYVFLGALHHHPTPVERPDWYAQPFYERILGRSFDRTDALEDAERFLRFAEQRAFSAILHGHKHIPRVGKTPTTGIPVYGCGSSVGKVATRDGTAYMSINVVTVDTSNGQVVGRLLAERIPGGGLVEERRHEMVLRSRSRVTGVA